MNMHDVFVVGIPLIAIIAGILLSLSDMREVRAELRSEMATHHTEIMAKLADLKSITQSITQSIAR